MKVSVVIPAHNEEANIAEVIRAVIDQDHPDFEVIVVDNASTDRTAEIAGRFPIKLVHEPRKGLLWAREAGRKAASGEIVANIDADCRPESDWISNGVSNFVHESIVAVTGPYDYYDGSKAFRSTSLFTQRYFYKPISLFLQSSPVRAGAVLIGGNNFIRSHVLHKEGGYNTALVFYGEDTDTAKRVAKHGRIIFDPKLSMRTSARRFKAEGTARLLSKYWYHFFKHILSPNKKAA